MLTVKQLSICKYLWTLYIGTAFEFDTYIAKEPYSKDMLQGFIDVTKHALMTGLKTEHNLLQLHAELNALSRAK